MYLVPCSFSRASSSQNTEKKSKVKNCRLQRLICLYCKLRSVAKNTTLMSFAKDLSNPKAGIISAKSPSNILYRLSFSRDLHFIVNVTLKGNEYGQNQFNCTRNQNHTENMPPHITFSECVLRLYRYQPLRVSVTVRQVPRPVSLAQSFCSTVLMINSRGNSTSIFNGKLLFYSLSDWLKFRGRLVNKMIAKTVRSKREDFKTGFHTLKRICSNCVAPPLSYRCLAE